MSDPVPASPSPRARLEQILRAAARQGATDIHLKPGEPVLLRVAGELRAVNSPKLTSDEIRSFYFAIRPPSLSSIDAETLHEVDFSVALTGSDRFRASAFRQRGSLALIFKTVQGQAPDLKELNLPEALSELASRPSGLVLVGGLAGSGVSSTLAAMVGEVNRARRAHVITLEDPITHVIPNERASIVQREVGLDTATFASGLRSALRQDPDVIVVGRIETAETFELALRAAESGCLVLCAMEAIDALGAIDRIDSLFPGAQQATVRVRLAEVLLAVAVQRLIPRTAGGGKIPAVEFLPATREIRGCLRDPGLRADLVERFASGSEPGTRTFDQDIRRLLRSQQITREAALAASSEPSDFDLQLKLAGEGIDDMLIERHRYGEPARTSVEDGS